MIDVSMGNQDFDRQDGILLQDRDYTIYMGIDKSENEEIIRYDIPEDTWYVCMCYSIIFVLLRSWDESILKDNLGFGVGMYLGKTILNRHVNMWSCNFN